MGHVGSGGYHVLDRDDYFAFEFIVVLVVLAVGKCAAVVIVIAIAVDGINRRRR